MLKTFCRALFLFTTFILFSFESTASAISLLENTSFVRAKGKPKVETVQFSYQAGQQFQLTVFNGGENKQYCRISSAVIELNGTTIFSQSDFNQQVFKLTSDVQLQSSNTLSVKLSSKPSCGIELNVSGEELSPALEIISSPSSQTISGELYQYTLATNILLNWDNASVELVTAPEGMTVTNSTISWTPNNSQVSIHDINLQVIDAEFGIAEQNFELNVISANQAPIANDIVVNGVEDNSVDIQLTAIDPNNDSMMFELLSEPEHGTVQQNGAQITYTPVDNFFGNDSFEFVAKDDEFNSKTATVTIEITGENDAPVIVSEPLLSVLENSQYVYLVETIDVDGDLNSFSLLQSPVGMSIDATTGELSWLPSSEQLGEHTVVIAVADPSGATVEQSYLLQVVNVNDAPSITSSPVTISNEDDVYLYNVVATDPDVEDTLTFSLEIAPVGMIIDSVSGLVSWTPNNSQVGNHSVTLSVSDSGGLTASQSFVMVINNVNNAPIANIDTYTVNEDEILTVNINEGVLANDSDVDGDILTASVNSLPSNGSITLNTDGSFTYTPIANFFGNDSFSYVALDENTQSEVATVSITVNSMPEAMPSISINADPLQIISGGSSTLSWSVTNADSISFNENIDSQQFVDSIVVSPIVTTTYILTATGEGGTISDSVTIVVESDITLPPNPTDIAPTLNPTQVVNLKDSVEFLFTGDNPIQTGVNADDISAKRVAVVRGQVLNKDNTPLSGVTITIKDHTEYGQTLSRVDGLFDMAINGGGYVTINYAKGGYLPVQRQINTPWRDFVIPENVVMIQLDPQVTTIDLTSSQDIQIAQGTIQTDADGDRQATMFFPKGTSATMVMPDGSTQSLTTLNVRVTEYTVGENGRNTMPGELPAFSGYTYAVELSVDEAIAAGATRVDFNQEIPIYVDNFLGFPTGEVVPVGWYDHKLSAWIPSNNGRIIEILSITNGLADLDVEGNGNIAEQAALDELGIKEEELRQIASTFVVGKKLWRSPIDHFTPWDFNWPYGPPEGAIPPLNIEPLTLSENTPEAEDADQCKGCIIEAQSQTLGEEISIVATPMKLHYRSDRAEGNKKDNTLAIPVSGNTIPSKLQSIEVLIDIAGQHIEKVLPAMPNHKVQFLWDGLNVYGQKLNVAEAKITVNYVYKAAYYSSRKEFSASFGQLASDTTPLALSVNESDRLINVSRTWTKLLFSANDSHVKSANLGGWTTSQHHSLDPITMILKQGNGEKQSIQQLRRRTTAAVVGNGHSWNYGDGGNATEAGLDTLFSFDIDDDGSIYFKTGVYIRKVDANGIITTVAGNGNTGYSGDGGDATSASLEDSFSQTPFAIEKGSIYFQDGSRIRKINPEGIITTIAGNGNHCVDDDFNLGMPARASCLNSHSSLAIASDGSVYFGTGHRIYKVTPNGILEHVAGNGEFGFNGDGKLATETSFYTPHEIYINEDGSIYFSDSYSYRIRKIANDGIVSTIAGGGHIPRDSVNGVLATDANLLSFDGDFDIDSKGNIYFIMYYKLYIINNEGIVSILDDISPTTQYRDSDIAIDSDDNVYILNSKRYRIYKTTAHLLPEFSEVDSRLVPSKDGLELFTFTAEGKHIKTQDTISGVDTYTFDYTDNGYLNSITDVNNRLTSFIRDFEGNIEAIIAPDGQRTDITINEQGYLGQVTNPQGNFLNFVYTDDGLLLQRTDAKGNHNQFEYDGTGLLLSDTDPLGGGWTLSREHENEDKSYTVAMASGENRVRSFRVVPLTTGERQQIKTAPDGAISTEQFLADGGSILTSSNGTITTISEGADPRFGLMSPIIKSYSELTPNGLQRISTGYDTTSLADVNDKLSHASLIKRRYLNGKLYTNQLDTLTKTWTNTSPEGRISTNELDVKGRSIETTVNNLASINFIYNTEGRVSNITQGGGLDSRETRLAYYNSGAQQGFLESITDAANRETSYSYDNAGLLLTQTLSNGNDINFNYDANGNITSITPANNETHTFDYTQVDETSDYTPPDVAEIAQPSTQYSYNLDKQLELISLPDGQEVDYVYHATKGHKIQAIIPRGNFDYVYNSTTGQIEQVTAPDGGKIEFTYDGSLVLSAQLTGDVSGKVNQIYNNDFQITQRCVNTSDCINFSYDNDLLLTQAGDLTINRASQKGGLITGSSLGNINTTNTYNDFGEPLSTSTNDSDVYSVDYTRDKLGRITQKVETIQGVTTTFGYNYDLLGQLSTVTTNDVLTNRYSFDDNGNRTHINDVTIATFDTQDRLKQHGDYQYLYTDNGDLISKTNTATNKSGLYHYDVLGNLISAAIPDDNSATTTQIEYIIDAQNRRVGKKVNDTLIQGFLYKDQLNPIAELDGTGAIVSRFVYGSKDFVPDYMFKDGKTYRIISDHLGSPRLIINISDSAVAQHLDYDVWGNITLDSNPGFQPFGFAGGLYDQHTKLTRFGARDYDAEIGRWTTKDPIGLNGGLNVYGYVNGNPVNYLDVDGQNPILIGCLVGAAAQGFTGLYIDLSDDNSCGKGGGETGGDIASSFVKNALGGCAFGALTVAGAGSYGVIGTIGSSIGGLAIDAGLNFISLFGG